VSHSIPVTNQATQSSRPGGIFTGSHRASLRTQAVSQSVQIAASRIANALKQPKTIEFYRILLRTGANPVPKGRLKIRAVQISGLVEPEALILLDKRVLPPAIAE
jgi:hypothetical protein